MKLEVGDKVVVKECSYIGYPLGSNYNLPRGEGVVIRGGTDLGFLIVDYSGVVSPPVNPHLFTKASDGPVRTVTRREIVDGRYGVVIVSGHRVSIHGCSDHTELRAAAATLIEIADALEDE